MTDPIRDESAPTARPLSLANAALTAGVALLVVTVTAVFAQFYAFPSLLVAGDVAQTVENLTENRGLFAAGILAYALNYAFDIVVAWALWVLFRPVSRDLSMLAFAVCLIYVAMALTGVLKYVEAFRLTGSPDAVAALGFESLSAHVYVLAHSYTYDWGFSLILFGLVLGLRGILVLRSPYVPSFLGVLLLVAGTGYVVYVASLYVLPDVDLGFLTITFLGEPVFMVWLLLKGRGIPEPGERLG